MKIILLCLLTIKTVFLTGQLHVVRDKPAIDTSVLDKWPKLANPGLSNDGRYAYYCITNQPVGSNTLVVTKTDLSWKTEMIVGSSFINGTFTGNNRKFIYLDQDSLRIITLGTQQIKVVPNVSSLLFSCDNGDCWAAYKCNNARQELVFKNLTSGQTNILPYVDSYSFDKSGNKLLVATDSFHTFKLFNLRTQQSSTIWHSDADRLGFYTSDTDGSQVVFIVQAGKEGQTANSVWYYKEGMRQAALKVTAANKGIPENAVIGSFAEFSGNARWIFFPTLFVGSASSPDPNATQVNVWSYRDTLIQPKQQYLLQQEPPTFLAAVNVNSSVVQPVETITEKNQVSPAGMAGDHIVVSDELFQYSSRYWLSKGPSYYLLSLKDGSRKLLNNHQELSNFRFSPDGKFLIYYDRAAQHYFSYDILTDQLINVTHTLSDITSFKADEAFGAYVDDIPGWERSGRSFLAYDNYDIWKLDPSAKTAPVCITNRNGYRNKIKYRLFEDEYSYTEKDTFYLSGYSAETKCNGLFRKASTRPADPLQLVMGSYVYYRQFSQTRSMGSMGQKPIKAKKANYWIVQRESATEAPNYFITADFDTFTPLTDIQPHRSVNWLTAELITFKKIDGRTGQGVLYKPENFDSSKKYPVIFHYYDRLSQLKNEFLYPAAIIADLNVPWFVSNGYLVVLSDNEYQENGKPKIAECFNSVVAAAKYVSALSYVDPGKLGLQGHSWGGGQTNYLITHSNLFAAAAEFAGGSDNISSYLGLVYHTGIEHIDKMKQGEWTHGKGKSLWENKNDFLLTNHILNADKITSPLLITHNRKDNSIGFWNAVELYMALRRLNKKSWLLEYDNGDHAIYGKDAIDYTIRLTQFFDHYLKGKPAPVWMTRGIPARLKGVTDGFAVDQQGTCGNDCPICAPSQKK